MLLSFKPLAQYQTISAPELSAIVIISSIMLSIITTTAPRFLKKNPTESMLFKIHAHQPKEHLRHINHHLSCHGRGRTNHQRIFTAKMAMRQVIGHLQTMGSECVNTLIYLDEVLYDLRLTILTPPSHPKKMRGLTGDQDQPFQK